MYTDNREMIVMEIFLHDRNINIDEFIGKYLGGLSEDLKNNPKFKIELECEWLVIGNKRYEVR